MTELIRHGEIMLVPSQSPLFGRRETVTSFVVGHSESGHDHVLDCDAVFDIITVGEDVLIELSSAARLSHLAATDADRHRELDVPPGTYRIAHKRSYNPVHELHGFVAD